MLHPVTFRSLAVVAFGGLLACDATALGMAPGNALSGPAAMTAQAAPAAPAAVRPRLKLEPLDLAEDRAPVLRLSRELRIDAAADPQRRAAAAALWRVLQGGPEQALQDALRLQDARGELKSVREDVRRNARAVTQLRGEGDGVRSGRGNASAAIVALATALLALLTWLAWRWRRDADVARLGRWFAGNSELAQPPMPIVDAAAARRMTAASAQPVRAPAPAPAARPAPPQAAAAPAPAPAASLHTDANRRAGARKVDVEELVDLHDKTDFFLSIGEHGQAIGALEAHVRDHEAGALPWMLLLELYQRFGHRADYESARAGFQQRFGVQGPDFDLSDRPMASLEDCGGVLDGIVQLWPSRQGLDAIGGWIVRGTGLPGPEPFSLQAYRDLVLLYHVARDLLQEQEEPTVTGAAAGFDFTALQPLQEQPREVTQPGTGSMDRLLIPPASPRLGVDIDLGEEGFGAPRPLDFDISGYEPPAREGRGGLGRP